MKIKLVRGEMLVAMVSLLWVSHAAAGEAAPVWLTGRALYQQLESTIPSASWSDTSFREAAESLSKIHRVAVLVDRRVDPDAKVRLSLNRQSLGEVFQAVAAKSGQEIGLLGPVLYIGPAEAAGRLRTLSRLRRNELTELSPQAARQFLATSRMHWDDFASPRDLLRSLADENGFELVGLDQVPHDLWAKADLPPLSLLDRMTLLAVQFDLTFQIEPDASRVTLVPIPDDVAVEEQDRIAASQRSDAASNSRSTSQKPTAGTFTGRVKGILGQLVKDLAKNFHLELRMDERALEEAGISLAQPVSVNVKDATLDDLFHKILKPAGCDFRREGKVIFVFPAEQGPS